MEKYRTILWRGRVEATVFEPQIVAYTPYNWYGLEQKERIGVALPCRLPDVLRKNLRVTLIYKDQALYDVPIIDVGPWFVTDAYFLHRRRPLAESTRFGYRGERLTNRAAIDLTIGAAEALGFTGCDEIELLVSSDLLYAGEIEASSILDENWRVGRTETGREYVFLNREGYTIGNEVKGGVLDDMAVWVYYKP